MRKRIVVDWGTSNFRAYRYAPDGAVMDTHAAAAGILTVTDGAFATVLAREIGAWLDAGTEVYLSGMITSRNGWVETPYVDLPAGLDDLAASVVVRPGPSGAALMFLPGVAARHPMPDVMRGEEIQIFGAVEAEENVTLVLPGTHSKWARVEAGRILAYRSFMMGETFAVMKNHSILGRLMPAGDGPAHPEAFDAGVRQALSPDSVGLLNDLFTTRSGVLLGAFAADEIAERLSGLLIGHEIRGGLSLARSEEAVILVGDDALCDRYARALRLAGRTSRKGPPLATVRGFERLIATRNNR